MPKAPSLDGSRKRRERDVEGVEGLGMGRGYPLPSQLGNLGSIVSSPCAVRGGAPAEIEFVKSECQRGPFGVTYFTEFVMSLERPWSFGSLGSATAATHNMEYESQNYSKRIKM